MKRYVIGHLLCLILTNIEIDNHINMVMLSIMFGKVSLEALGIFYGALTLLIDIEQMVT